MTIALIVSGISGLISRGGFGAAEMRSSSSAIGFSRFAMRSDRPTSMSYMIRPNAY